MTAVATAPPAFALRPYQIAGLEAIGAAVARDVRRQCLVWPTGAGKTILFAVVIARRGGRALILVHRDELVQQTLDKLHLIGPDLQVGVVKAERNETGVQVVVASVQTLARESRLHQLLGGFTTIVVDEAHHGVADSYVRVIEYATATGEPLLLGVTATPDRLDRLGLEHIFDEIVHQVGLLELMQQGYLCDIRALRVVLDLNLDNVHRRGGDFVESKLAAVLDDAGAPRYAAAAYAEHARDRKGVVFTASVKQAHATAAYLGSMGIAAEALDGTTPFEHRRAILRRLHDGTTRVVANCMVLTEGFDEPSIDAIVLARPTQSRPLYQQMIGRGLRPYPGKSDCLIVDLVGNSGRHELVTAASLFGLDPNDVTERGVLEADQIEQERQQRQEKAIRDGQLVAHEVDLFGRSGLIWTSTGRAHVLSLGDDGFVGVEPAADGSWRVLVLDSTQWGARLREMYRGLDQGYALGIAEELARQHVPRILRDPHAAWRREPIGAGQREFYARRGWSPPTTKGEASERMTHYFAELAWRRARR